MSVEVICSDLLAGTEHGFLGRRGGISSGQYAGLNVGPGSDDLPRAVAANRARAVDAVMPGAALCTVYQVHSAEVATIRSPFPDDARPRADAMVTDRPGLLLGILTADCAPVLLSDPAAGVVGAAHAGWRGALDGVTDNTIQAMEQLGASRDGIAAAIGPCIAQKSYEVDDGFRLTFCGRDEANERFFKDGRAGHAQFDLSGYVAARLSAAGISRIEIVGEDTCSQPDRFFSYRRATLNGEAGYGHQISLVGMAS